MDSASLKGELLDNLREGIFLLGADDRLEYINCRPSEVFGEDLEVLTDRPLARLFERVGLTEEQADRVRRAIRSVRERAYEEDRVEVPVRTGEAERRTLEVRASLLRGGDDRVVLVTRDVTQRARAEEQLRERETRLSGLANSIPGVVFQFVARNDGTYTNYFISEHARSVLGLAPDPEDFFERFVERVPESHREELIASIDEAVQAREKWEHETPFEKPSGERIWVRGISTPDPREDELVFNGVLLETTDRREREQSLQRSRRRFEAIFEDPNMLVGLIDLDGTLTDVNETALSYVDVAWSDVVGEPFWETPWFAEENRVEVREWIERAVAGEYVEFEIDIPGQSRYRTVTGTVRPVRNEEGEVDSLVISDRDVTERIEYERELIEAREEARSASRMKSAVLENLSHELRTPLASILGFSDLIHSEVDDRLQQFVRIIRESGRRLHDTLDAVLNLAQLEAEGIEFRPERIDAAEAIGRAVLTLEPEAQRKGLHLEGEGLDRDVPAVIDPSFVSRITTHLVSNAVKFTQEGTITIALSTDEDHLLLEVRDPGIGMDAEGLSRVFDPFYQASSGLGREYEGTGLGLTIAKRLTEVAGGEIEVDSQKGEGTVVTVELPRDCSDHPSYEPASPEYHWGLDQLPGDQRILLVEDDSGMRELLREMLPDAFEIDEAPGPQEALERIGAASYDLILMDINLQADQNGVDLLHHIRAEAEAPGPLVVAITAYATSGDAESFREEGFDGYVAKPFTRETLRKNLIQVVADSSREAPTSENGQVPSGS